MRVSTTEQNLALQHDALLAAGIAPERIYDDTCCGAVTNHAYSGDPERPIRSIVNT